MATELHSIVERILNKSSVLVEKYQALEIEKMNVEQKLQEVQAETEVLRKEVERLKLDNEYLRMARAIAPSYELLAESRAAVSQLVRDVDKCISQLT